MYSLPRDRAIAAAAAVALQLLLVYALIAGFAVTIRRQLASEMATFGIIVPPPAPPPPPPAPRRSHAAQGKAAPAALKAHATEIVAPVKTPEPTPVIAAPKAGIGAAPSQGAAPVPGPGSGAGGTGEGTGSGSAGNGEGDGGTPAEWLRGEIRPHDYPRDLVESGRGGTVGLRFTVGVAGRVTDCQVTRSSGMAALDAATCALILKRFRYRPARDAAGNPVPDAVTGAHVWEVLKPPPAPGDDENR